MLQIKETNNETHSERNYLKSFFKFFRGRWLSGTQYIDPRMFTSRDTGDFLESVCIVFVDFFSLNSIYLAAFGCCLNVGDFRKNKYQNFQVLRHLQVKLVSLNVFLTLWYYLIQVWMKYPWFHFRRCCAKIRARALEKFQKENRGEAPLHETVTLKSIKHLMARNNVTVDYSGAKKSKSISKTCRWFFSNQEVNAGCETFGTLELTSRTAARVLQRSKRVLFSHSTGHIRLRGSDVKLRHRFPQKKFFRRN